MINEPPYSSHEIEQIKEKLFGEERQKLNYLQDFVSSHQDRIGTDIQFQSSVAKIIAGALLEAGIANHKELSTAIAPLIINVVRQEIRNSKSEIAHTLYPQMGKLISSYLSSNLNQFIHGTNQTIERAVSPKYMWLTLKSVITGKPYDHLLLEAAKIAQIRDIMLINKETGHIIEHWQAPEREKASRYDVSLISGMLTAINNFSQEAFVDDHSELSALNFGNSCIYIRSTPLLMVAVSCTGRANEHLERAFDAELLKFLERSAYTYPQSDSVSVSDVSQRLLPDLVARLSNIVTSEMRYFKEKRFKRYPVFSITFLSLFLLSISSWATTKYFEEKSRIWIAENIDGVVAQQKSFNGFPVNIEVDKDDKTVRLSGLSPSREQTEILVQEVRKKYPDVRVVPHLVPVFSEQRFRKILGGLKTLDQNNASASAASKLNSKLNEGEEDKSASAGTAGQTEGKLVKKNLESHKAKIVHNKRDTPPEAAKKAVPENIPALFNNLPSIKFEDTLDFNNPEVQQEMEKAKKFVVPKRLQKKNFMQKLKGEGHPSSGSNAGGNSGNSSGSQGNGAGATNGQGNGASNSNKANAPGQLKK